MALDRFRHYKAEMYGEESLLNLVCKTLIFHVVPCGYFFKKNFSRYMEKSRMVCFLGASKVRFVRAVNKLAAVPSNLHEMVSRQSRKSSQSPRPPRRGVWRIFVKGPTAEFSLSEGSNNWENKAVLFGQNIFLGLF